MTPACPRWHPGDPPLPCTPVRRLSWHPVPPVHCPHSPTSPSARLGQARMWVPGPCYHQPWLLIRPGHVQDRRPRATVSSCAGACGSLSVALTRVQAAGSMPQQTPWAATIRCTSMAEGRECDRSREGRQRKSACSSPVPISIGERIPSSRNSPAPSWQEAR